MRRSGKAGQFSYGGPGEGGEEYQGEGEREGGEGGGVEVYRENKNPTVGMWVTICFDIAFSK